MRTMITIEDDLRKHLDELYRDITRARERGDDPQEIEQRTAMFEIDWYDRLLVEQRAELAGSKAAVKVAVKEFTHQIRFERYQREAAVLPAMSPDQQAYFWNSTNHALMSERDQAKLAIGIQSDAETSINGKYSNLRYAVEHAVHEIVNGREPSLNQILSEQRQKERAPIELTAPVRANQNEALVALVNRELENIRTREAEDKELER